MVQRFIKKVKSILFADPKLLFEEERHLINQPFFFLPHRQAGLSADEAGEGVNNKGVLLLHGWTSTPYEVRRLGKYLNEKGYTVLGIQLSGHGTLPKDLENIRWQQWLDDTRAGYAKLKQTCEKVYVGGTSIGGSLAMLLAEEQADVAGLILMATPYKMRLEAFALIIAKLFSKICTYQNKFYPPTFGLSTTITRLISYQSYPVASGLEAFEIVKEARKNIAKIKQPCLIMQSTHDHIVAKDSLEQIYVRIGSAVKKKKYIEKAYHTFISDIKNEHVFMDIWEFLENN